jgi:hypothetical protein
VHVLLQAVATEAERVKQRKADQEKHNAAAAGVVAAAAGAGSMQQRKDDADAEQQEEADAAGGSSSRSSSLKPPKRPDVEKNPSARPDRVAESCILNSGRAVNRLGKPKDVKDTFGHLPGIPINHV